MRRLPWLVPFLCLVGAPRRSAAQTCQVSGSAGSCAASTTATLTTTTLLQLTVSAPSTTVAAPSVADYDAGFAASTGPTAVVKANAPWTLQIASTTSVFSATNTDPTEPARTTKPASDLQWSLAASGTYTGMTLTASTLTTGVPTAGSSIPLYFRVLLSYALDTPGNYSLPLLFTLVSP